MNIISCLIEENAKLQATHSLNFEEYKKIAYTITCLDSESQTECISFLIPFSFQEPFSFTIYHIVFQEYVKKMKKINNKKKLNKVILRSLIQNYPEILSLNIIKYLDYLDCIDWYTIDRGFSFLGYVFYHSIINSSNELTQQVKNVIQYLYKDHDIYNEEDSINIKLCIEYFNHTYSPDINTYSFPTSKDVVLIENIIQDSSPRELLEKLNYFSTKYNYTIKDFLNIKDMYNRPLYIYLNDYDLFDSFCSQGVIDKKDLYKKVIYEGNYNIPLYKIVMDNIQEENIPKFLEKYVGLAIGDCNDYEKTHNECIKLIVKENVILHEGVLKYLL